MNFEKMTVDTTLWLFPKFLTIFFKITLGLTPNILRL